MKTKPTNPLLERLRYHVTGAIERGQGKAIVEQPTPEVIAFRRKIGRHAKRTNPQNI